MAKSKYEYVRNFERDDKLLPNTYIVVRIDGKGFHNFSKLHCFIKPNDERALQLANHCAVRVLEAVNDISVAYGESDEYSFVFPPLTDLFGRRESKLTSLVVSLFTANYVHAWPQFFPDTNLKQLPSFDGRTICYPSLLNIRDYLRWRQADCHINNLYNTAFWALVQQGGLTERAAQEQLKGTLSANKNELLFSRFDINYNLLPEIYRKGTVVYRTEKIIQKDAMIPTKYVKQMQPSNNTTEIGNVTNTDNIVLQEEKEVDVNQEVQIMVTKKQKIIEIAHCDIIGDTFWNTHSKLLS